MDIQCKILDSEYLILKYVLPKARLRECVNFNGSIRVPRDGLGLNAPGMGQNAHVFIISDQTWGM